MMDHKKNQQSNKYAFFESILFFLFFFDATIIKSFFLTFYRRKYNENKVNLFWDGKEVLKQQTKNSAEQLNTAKFLSLFSQYFSHIWFDVYFFHIFQVIQVCIVSVTIFLNVWITRCGELMLSYNIFNWIWL